MKQVTLSEEELEQLKLEVDYLLRKGLQEVRELEARNDRSTDEFLIHARQLQTLLKGILQKLSEARDV